MKSQKTDSIKEFTLKAKDIAAWIQTKQGQREIKRTFHETQKIINDSKKSKIENEKMLNEPFTI